MCMRVGIPFWLFHWLIILPVIFVLPTPYVLIAAAFREGPYRRALDGYYKAIFRTFAGFWDEGGWGFTP